MNKLFTVIVEFIGKLFGKGTVPAEVVNTNTHLARWREIYRGNAAWLENDYVTVDGVRRHRKRASLRMAKVACSEAAGLVLAETPGVDAGDLVKNLIDEERFWDNLKQRLEDGLAVGGLAIKLYVTDDDGFAEHLDFVTAENFIPLTSDNARVTEASFIDRRTVDGESFIRVETHRVAKVEVVTGDDGKNHYAEGVAGVPGYKISSAAFSEKTGKAIALADVWPNVKPEIVVPIDVPLFVYIKNPEANNIEPGSPLGISLFANAEDTIRALDIAFDQLVSEVELGGRRIALPGYVFRKVQDVETGKITNVFDETDRVFMRFESDDDETLKPQDLTFNIRSDQFKGAIQTLLDLFAMQVGFSAGSFAFDGQSVKTATEVVSENSKTYKTIASIRGNLDVALTSLFRAINAVGVLYQIEGATEDGAVKIAWDDGIIEDRNTRAKYHIDLVNAKLESRESAIKAIHKLDDEKAAAMAEKVTKDNATVDAFGL